jgi:hypothetical protein
MADEAAQRERQKGNDADKQEYRRRAKTHTPRLAGYEIREGGRAVQFGLCGNTNTRDELDAPDVSAQP